MNKLKKTLSAKPPMTMSISNNDLVKKEQERNFINEGWVTVPSPADSQSVTTSSTVTDTVVYPWDSNRVREDVFKVFNVRLREPLFLKLKHISQLQRRSTNSICEELIQEFVSKESDSNKLF